MKFCPVVPEICRGQVHGPRKERRKRIIIIIIIIIRNGAKTISLPNNNNYSESSLKNEISAMTPHCQLFPQKNGTVGQKIQTVN